MDKFLLIVEETYKISGRGLAVMPFVLPEIVGSNHSGYKARVRLVYSDGTERIVIAAFHWQHFSSKCDLKGWHFTCLLPLEKEEVPLRTEIWLVN